MSTSTLPNVTFEDSEGNLALDVQAMSSQGRQGLISDPESIGRRYEIRDELGCLKETQNSCSLISWADSSAVESNTEEEIDPELLPIPIWNWRDTLPQEFFFSLQKWEGVVLDVYEDSFFARLSDLTEDGLEEEGEFYIDDVSREDLPLLKPGAVFYWNIGYHDSRTGQRRKVSEIRFRRLPAWTAKEIDAAKSKAIELKNLFGWEKNESATEAR